MTIRIKIGTHPAYYYELISPEVIIGEVILIKETDDEGAKPFRVMVEFKKDINGEALYYVSRW